MKPVLLATDGSPTATKAAETRRRQIGTLRALGFPAQPRLLGFGRGARRQGSRQATLGLPLVGLAHAQQTGERVRGRNRH